MKKLLVASSNQEVLSVVKSACLNYTDYFEPIFCPETDEALSFVDYELPEIKILFRGLLDNSGGFLYNYFKKYGRIKY